MGEYDHILLRSLLRKQRKHRPSREAKQNNYLGLLSSVTPLPTYNQCSVITPIKATGDHMQQTCVNETNTKVGQHQF